MNKVIPVRKCMVTTEIIT